MKSSAILAISVAALALCACDNSVSVPKPAFSFMNGNVASVKTTYYIPSNNQADSATWVVRDIETVDYDEEGNLVSNSKVDRNGDTLSYVNRTIKDGESVASTQMILAGRQRFIYGKLLKKAKNLRTWEYMKDTTRTVSELRYDGLKLTCISDGAKKYEITYNEKGRILEELDYKDDAIVTRIKNTYDMDGNPVSTETYDEASGKLTEGKYAAYISSDDKGNWTEREVTDNNGVVTGRLTREITYR